MKKICLIIYLLSIFVLSNFKVYAVNEEDVAKENENVKETKSTLDLAKNATSAIMLEASTGEIIFQKNVNEKRPPASMTKMMSMLLIMENIEKGNLTFEEEVTASAYASSMGGSQIFLKAGEKMKVEDLLKGIAIGSGNDATVAMAERIAGTEEAFVKLMNDRAKELGLNNTNFKNSTGLDVENHYSTAYDMSVIARELVKHKKILEFTGTYEDYLRKDSASPFWLVNTNRLVRFYQGVDGLKTGYTKEAGYCLTSTAEKDNMRLITVVMNEPSTQIRNGETSSMLDYGFNMYSVNKILDTDTSLQKSKVELGSVLEVEIVPTEEVKILNNKNSDERNVTYELELNTIKAPVKKGDIVGKIKVYEDNKVINEINATVKYDVDKANVFKIYYRNLKNLFKGF
ncbi:MAG: D-alanyl-D-alanine carboxypeptidase [Bacilli bacterium]|nr:D-alanyl-D-alanine carboxypeptidase [Bacilli bacterium]